MRIKEEIIKIIEGVIGVKMIDNSIDLFKCGLNSLSVLKLITLIEDKLDIEIDDDDLTIENMSTVNTILNMVEKYGD